MNVAMGNVCLRITLWYKWNRSIKQNECDFFLCAVLTGGTPIKTKTARLTARFDVQNGRAANRTVWGVPCCVFLIVPVTIIGMDCPGCMSALNRQRINECIIWNKVSWRKRRLAIYIVIKVKLIHKDINTEFLKINNCIFRILKQRSSRVWGLISKLITVIICDKMLWWLLVMC